MIGMIPFLLAVVPGQLWYAAPLMTGIGVLLFVGAILGVLLGLYTSNGEIPGLDNDTAARVAEGHPPAMVIGFLILAAMAVTEWLLRNHTPQSESRTGTAQMWFDPQGRLRQDTQFGPLGHALLVLYPSQSQAQGQVKLQGWSEAV